VRYWIGPKSSRNRIPVFSLSDLYPESLLKEGIYSAYQDAVINRAIRARLRSKEHTVAMRGSKKRDIIVVTHGMFMKDLAGDPEIDLPKAGWRSYTIRTDQEVGVVLERV